MMRSRFVGVLLASLLMAGCASTDPTMSNQRSDPLEGFNRAMFGFNYNVLDPYVVRPVAVAWRNYVPEPARNGTRNFLTNLSEPASMVNSFLVGDIKTGMKHFTRFFLNSTLGMAGLIDVASMANPQQLGNLHSQRFGSTLGRYNVGYGPYMVLPAYGSFTLREEGGNYADYLYPVFSWITGWTAVGKWAVEGIDARAQLLDSDGMIRNSADPYIFVREAYFQNRDFRTNRGNSDSQPNPNASAIEDDLKDIDSYQ